MEDISDYILEDGFPGFRVFLPDVGRFQVLWTFRNLRICGKGKKLEVLLQIWASRISGWVKIHVPDLKISVGKFTKMKHDSKTTQNERIKNHVKRI